MHFCVTCLQLALRYSVRLASTRRSGKTLSIGQASGKTDLGNTLSSRHRIKTNLLPKLSRSPRHSKRKCPILSKSCIASPATFSKEALRVVLRLSRQQRTGPAAAWRAVPATRFSHQQARVIAQNWCAFVSSYSYAVRSPGPDCLRCPSAASAACRMPPIPRAHAASLRSRPAAFAR